MILSTSLSIWINVRERVTTLSVLTKINSLVIEKSLPKPNKTKWPNLEEQSLGDNSPSIRLAQAELKAAESRRSRAGAEAFPDIKIGPVVKVQKDNVSGIDENLAGVSLSMPLPVFTFNGGGRAYAEQKLIEAKMLYDLEQKKIQNSKEQLYRKYQNLVKTLKETLNEDELNNRHEIVEREFFRGLVSSALVIEAHRQLFEYIEKRNQSELETIEVLGQILIQNNKFDGVIL